MGMVRRGSQRWQMIRGCRIAKDENLRCKNGNFYVLWIEGGRDLGVGASTTVISGSYELRSSGITDGFLFQRRL